MPSASKKSSLIQKLYWQFRQSNFSLRILMLENVFDSHGHFLDGFQKLTIIKKSTEKWETQFWALLSCMRKSDTIAINAIATMQWTLDSGPWRDSHNLSTTVVTLPITLIQCNKSTTTVSSIFTEAKVQIRRNVKLFWYRIGVFLPLTLNACNWNK